MSDQSYVWEIYQWFLDKHAKGDAAMLTLATAIMEHAKATRAIAHGDVHGMGGLEALAVAIAGKGLDLPLSTAVYDAASTISEAMDTE